MKETTVMRHPVTNRPITEQTLRDLFEQAMAARTIIPETRKTYRDELRPFLSFVNSNGLRKDTYRKYKRFLADKEDVTIATKNHYLTSARIPLKELTYEGILTPDITINTRGFTREKKHKRDGLNKHELGLIAKHFKTMAPTPINNRLKAIMALMLFQGLRQKEITRIEIKDIDLLNKRARILGKKRDDREFIDLHPKTIRALKAHLSTRHLSCRDNSKTRIYTKNTYLFPGYKNRAGEKNRSMLRVRIGDIVRNCFRELGINKEPATLRHSFVVALIEQFRDLRTVQHFSRHDWIGKNRVVLYMLGVAE